jgi:CheY-like chemotaxis protein
MDHILVVDDDAGYLRVVTKALSLGGYRVTTACNGREALAALQHQRPSVILLDLAMPVMDGRAFAQELHGRSNPPRVILVTGASDGREQAEAIGACDYVSKPFDPMLLLEIVARAREGGAAAPS